MNDREFKVMNSKTKKMFQKHFEFRKFKEFGFDGNDKVILEIGCGSGYGAYLINKSYTPKHYTGIDVMPEQINLAKNYALKNTEFMEMDATDLSFFESQSIDLVVVFGILHHIPGWRTVINEVNRVLKPNGEFYVLEPFKSFIKVVDVVLKFNHEDAALFKKKEFEDNIIENGFIINKKANYLNLLEVLYCNKNENYAS